MKRFKLLVLFYVKISLTDCFAGLCGRFCSFTRFQYQSLLLWDFKDGWLCFVRLRDLNDSQLYKISMAVGFVPLQGFSGSRFCSESETIQTVCFVLS